MELHGHGKPPAHAEQTSSRHYRGGQGIRGNGLIKAERTGGEGEGGREGGG